MRGQIRKASGFELRQSRYYTLITRSSIVNIGDTLTQRCTTHHRKPTDIINRKIVSLLLTLPNYAVVVSTPTVHNYDTVEYDTGIFLLNKVIFLCGHCYLYCCKVSGVLL